MKKIIAIVALLVSLLLSNVAAAKFSDEYKAKYPRRVKTTTTQMTNGQMHTSTEYKLFKRNLPTGRIKLDVTLSDKGPDLCFLTVSTYGDSELNPIRELTWGDGKEAHKIQLFYSDFVRGGFRRYAELAIATVSPAELKKAIVISLNRKAVINESSKYWKEWQEALDTADRLMHDK